MMTDSVKIEQLLQDCLSANADVQFDAIFDLYDASVPIPLPTLKHLMNSPYWNVRSVVAELLGQRTSQRQIAGSLLLRLTSDPEPMVRGESIDSIGRLKYRPARESVEKALLKDPDYTVRTSAAGTLGKIRDTQAQTTLLQALQDPAESVRGEAAFALGWLSDPLTTIPVLDELLETETENIVKIDLYCAKFLLGDKSALDELINMTMSLRSPEVYKVVNRLEILINNSKMKRMSEQRHLSLKEMLTILQNTFPELGFQIDELTTKLG